MSIITYQSQISSGKNNQNVMPEHVECLIRYCNEILNCPCIAAELKASAAIKKLKNQ